MPSSYSLTTIKLAVSQMLGIPCGEGRGKYLGLPFLTSRAKNELFFEIKDRIFKKLSGWKEKLLSKAGKEILIKSVIQDIPSYAMQCFKLPKNLLDEILRMVRNFWWGQQKEERKIAWKSWDDMCLAKSEGGLGFRNLPLFNKGLLAKQCWRLLTKPTSLVAAIMQAKYYPGRTLMEAGEGPRASYLWRSLLFGRELLEKGIRWRVGHGHDIDVWRDPWIPLPPSFRPILQQPNHSGVRTVSDLMEPSTGQWKESLIQQLLLPFEAEAVLAIPISNAAMPSQIMWHYDRKGLYSVKSGYKLAFAICHRERRTNASTSAGDKKFWLRLWEAKIPPKLKHFLWRIAWNTLPVGVNLQRRSISNGRCSICHDALETDRHVFFECGWVRAVWMLVEHGSRWISLHATSFKDFLAARFEENEDNVQLALAILWAIWLKRNRIIFNGESPASTEIIRHAQAVISSYAQGASVVEEISHPTALRAHWRAPLVGTLKLNTDAACIEDKAAVRFLVRDHAGSVLQASSVPLSGRLTVENAELQAILLGIQSAKEIWSGPLIIESDCQSAILRLRAEEADYSEMGSIVDEIRRQAHNFAAISYEFVRRTGNCPAHLLAQLALSLPHVVSWDYHLPNNVLSAIHADINE